MDEKSTIFWIPNLWTILLHLFHIKFIRLDVNYLGRQGDFFCQKNKEFLLELFYIHLKRDDFLKNNRIYFPDK
jgi:hypothetical protein